MTMRRNASPNRADAGAAYRGHRERLELTPLEDDRMINPRTTLELYGIAPW